MLTFAQVIVVLRRWAVFWGLVRAVEGENAGTAYRRLRIWLARPRVRAAVIGLVAMEMVAAGSWIYTVHGTHLYRLGDEWVAMLRGQTIVYVGVCSKDGSQPIAAW